MPDRKVSYRIEIDTGDAQASAQRLREIFERTLADIRVGSVTAGKTAATPGAAMAADLRTAQQQGEATKRALADMAKVDLSAPVDKLISRVAELERTLTRARNRMEEIGNIGSNRQDAQFAETVAKIRHSAGNEAAQYALNAGYAPIGARSGEVASDQIYYDNLVGVEAKGARSRQRYSKEQSAEMAAAELEAYQAEAQLSAARTETARQQIAASDRLRVAMDKGEAELNEDTATVLAAAEEAEASMAQMMEEERAAFVSLENAHRRAIEQANQAQAEAQRAAGDIVTGPDAPGAATYGRQTAITVSQASVANAAALTEQIKAAVAAQNEFIESTRRLNETRAASTSAALAQEKELIAYRASLEAQNQKDKENRAKAAKEEAATERAARRDVAAAAKAAKREEAEAAKAAAAAEKAAAKERTAAEKELRKEEAEAARTAKKAATAAAREAAEAEKIAATRGVGSQISGAIGGFGRNLMYGAAGALGLYSLDQVARNAYGAGREGAQMERTAEVFDSMARSVGVSSNKMRAAIKDAAASTVSDIDAMTLANQLMAQRFAKSSTDLVGDTELMVAASRKFSQIYPTAEGQVQSVQDVYARLIGFIREGNKELVDQFGISNQRIAKALGISVDGLASSEGAALRYKGMLMILREELDRLGPAMDGAAGKIEAFEARIKNSADRAKIAWAPFTEMWANLGAAVAEGANAKFGPGNALEVTRSQVEALRPQWRNFTPDQIAGNAYLMYGRTTGTYDRAMAANEGLASQYANQLNAIGNDLINNRNVAESLTVLTDLNAQLELVAKGQDAYSQATRVATMTGIESNAEAIKVVTQMGDLQRAYLAGDLSVREYTKGLEGFRSKLAEIASIGGFGTPPAEVPYALGSTLFNVQNKGAPVPSWDVAMNQQYTSAVLANVSAQQHAGDLTQEEISGKLYGAYLQQETERGNEKRRQDAEIAKKAQDEWERAAEKAQQAFERAAEDSAGSFKSKAEKVPGLLGTSSVTEADMAKAKAGLPVEYSDSWLRRLKDVIWNGKSYEDINLEDAAKRFGWTGGLESEDKRKAFYLDAERQWSTSEAFAGGKNLDLINWAAYGASMNQQNAAESGQRAILSYIGLDPQRSTLSPEAQAAFARQIGIPDVIASGFAGAPGAAGAPSAAQASAAASASNVTTETIVGGMEADVTVYADRLKALGGRIADGIYTGFRNAVAQQTWGDDIINAIAADVTPIVMDAILDQMPPVP